MQQKALLIVMDGWGHGQIRAADAIADADTPFVRSLYHQYPNTELTTFGEAVGLPEGQMGNSEVGHLTIGAGRVIKQELPRINEALTNGELEHSPVLKAAFDHVLQEGTTLHLMGLVSDGGVHSHINHLIALCELAQKAGVANVAVHAFTDGRDTDPESGIGFLHTLLPVLEQSGAKLATLTGRYYAMDRDKRWDRVKLAYDAMTLGVGTKMTDALEAIQKSYDEGVTDEFLLPHVMVATDGSPVALIKNNDAVISFNFRTDR
jgi:2,3-bisphosphoglycerate-independent phosphoglycerate mutase